MDRVRQVMVDQLDINGKQVQAATTFVEDLRLGSGEMIQLLMAFADEFDFELSDVEGATFQTVGEAVRHIELVVSATSAA